MTGGARPRSRARNMVIVKSIAIICWPLSISGKCVCLDGNNNLGPPPPSALLREGGGKTSRAYFADFGLRAEPSRSQRSLKQRPRERPPARLLLGGLPAAGCVASAAAASDLAGLMAWAACPSLLSPRRNSWLQWPPRYACIHSSGKHRRLLDQELPYPGPHCTGAT
jgi:hypothetical protein